MAKRLYHDHALRLFGRAIASGAQRTGLGSARWDLSGSCTNPYWTAYVGRPEGEPRMFTFAGVKMTIHLDIATRCRRCEKCRAYRSWLWKHRMAEEMRFGVRTWYGTLTLTPSNHYRVMVEARRYTEARGVAWQSLSDDERFRARARISLNEVSKYVKRFRKRAWGAHGIAPMSWVCVTEKHKSGLPHFHMLVHERSMRPITHRLLSEAWGLGFERWRLVQHVEEPHAVAWYLCKYLTKDFSNRVRCSEKYGAERAATVGAAHAIFLDALRQNLTQISD